MEPHALLRVKVRWFQCVTKAEYGVGRRGAGLPESLVCLAFVLQIYLKYCNADRGKMLNNVKKHGLSQPGLHFCKHTVYIGGAGVIEVWHCMQRLCPPCNVAAGGLVQGARPVVRCAFGRTLCASV